MPVRRMAISAPAVVRSALRVIISRIVVVMRTIPETMSRAYFRTVFFPS
jgi:hypothetical protein